MKLRKPEILAVGFALATAILSFGWFGYFAPGKKITESKTEHPTSPSAAYQRGQHTVRVPLIVQWAPPPVQSRSGQWVYDLFTPPEIFYDATLAQFTVTPPATKRPDGPSDAPALSGGLLAGVQVVDVKPSLFRLQLIGYVKNGNECLGVFENRVTGEVLLAPKGRELPGLGLVIENIDLRRGEIPTSENKDLLQLLAVASIRDLATGESVLLSTAERCLGSTARATLVALNSSPTQREVGEGDVWEFEGETYVIDRIHLSPAAVVIERRGHARNDAERFTLAMPGAEPAQVSAPSL